MGGERESGGGGGGGDARGGGCARYREVSCLFWVEWAGGAGVGGSWRSSVYCKDLRSGGSHHHGRSFQCRRCF